MLFLFFLVSALVRQRLVQKQFFSHVFKSRGSLAGLSSISWEEKYLINGERAGRFTQAEVLELVV